MTTADNQRRSLLDQTNVVLKQYGNRLAKRQQSPACSCNSANHGRRCRQLSGITLGFELQVNVLSCQLLALNAFKSQKHA